MPTFGSLFAGIGGIDLGLERAGWTGRWQVEYEPFCQRVLAKHWPDVTRYGDIKDVDWSGVEPVDLVAGGFPCQPVSAAGHRKGQDDERWLWPEFLRCIRALRPSYVLMENVTNLLAIDDGAAFAQVLSGLAESGYDAEWDCIPAAAVGALHERDRVWVVAYPEGNRRAVRHREHDGRSHPAPGRVQFAEPVGGRSDGRTMAERWPTPTVAMHKGSSLNAMTRKTGASRLNDRLDYSVEQGLIANGRLNPTWVEWLMGFPLGWTDLGPSETRSSRKSSSSSAAASSKRKGSDVTLSAEPPETGDDL